MKKAAIKHRIRLPEHSPKELREGRPPAEQARPYIEAALSDAKHGKLGVRTRRQAIALGLRNARYAGVPIGLYEGVPPARGGATRRTSGRKGRR